MKRRRLVNTDLDAHVRNQIKRRNQLYLAILNEEREYVRSLSLARTVCVLLSWACWNLILPFFQLYIEPLRRAIADKKPIIGTQQIATLFSNIELIEDVSQQRCVALYTPLLPLSSYTVRWSVNWKPWKAAGRLWMALGKYFLTL